MNVFTGLAVGDVANVMNKAEVGFELKAVVYRSKFNFCIESVFRLPNNKFFS